MSKVFPFPVAPKATVESDDFADQNDTVVPEKATATMQRALMDIEPRKVAAHLQPVPEEGETTPWPSPFIPNAFLRFSLFGAQRERMASRSIFSREAKSVKDRYMVADTPHYRIEYDGAEALNSDDLIVLLVCLGVARKHGDMGAYVPISLNECNRFLWKAKSGRNITWFRQSLERLYKGYIRIEVDGVGIKRQRFLANYDDDLRDPNNPVYWIRIDKDMAPLFQADATEIDVVGMAHQQQYLARWLWSFYSTHDGRKDYSVTELQQLSGSSYLPLFKFRAKLRDAVKELMETKTITNDKGEQRIIHPMFGAGTTITKSDTLHVKKARRSMMIGPMKKDEAPKLQPVKIVELEPVDTRSAAVRNAQAQRGRVAL